MSASYNLLKGPKNKSRESLMQRREFLKWLSVPVVAVAVPELGRKIFLPPRGGWPLAERFSQPVWYTVHAHNPFHESVSLVIAPGRTLIMPPGSSAYIERNHSGVEAHFDAHYNIGDRCWVVKDATANALSMAMLRV